MYLIQWQSKTRIGNEGVPLQCENNKRVQKELVDWYTSVETMIQEWGSESKVHILYPPRMINRMQHGQSVEVFEVISDLSPEIVMVTYINSP